MSAGDNRHVTARGLATVADIVQAQMKCGWQATDPLNDDAVDGLILDRRHGADTGSIYFVQIKCGDGYRTETKKRPQHFGVNVGRRYILDHRPRWDVRQGPAILVYVEFGTNKAWWTDLKSEKSYTSENSSIILVPKSQRFGPHSIGHLRALRGYVDLDRALGSVVLNTSNLVVPRFSQSLRQAGRNFYSSWSKDPSRQINPALGRILVSRVGWRHLTRRGRGLATIMQSLTLLGAAEKIVRENNKAHQLNRPTVTKIVKGTRIREFLSLRSKVVFPTRQEAVVQVILMRLQIIEPSGTVTSRTWFYSVHEPRHARAYGIE